MRKLLAALIAVPLFTAGIFAVPAGAETTKNAQTEEKRTLAATAPALSEGDTESRTAEINHVRITWGDMTFAYNAARQWNTETYRWEAGEKEAVWTPLNEGGNILTFELLETEPEEAVEEPTDPGTEDETEEAETTAKIKIELIFSSADKDLGADFENMDGGSATLGDTDEETGEIQTQLQTALRLTGGNPDLYTKESLKENGGRQTVGTITVYIASADE